MANFSDVPSVDLLINSPEISNLLDIFGRETTLSAIRNVQKQLSEKVREGLPVPELTIISKLISSLLHEWFEPSLKPLINATGVILHTNLGRAPISLEVLLATQVISSGYCTLEYDLEQGKRGSRLIHSEKQFQSLTGVESAVVVNNNAGAVLLSLAAIAAKKKVVIARSQLIEIGGGFRIPDVMRQSGASLVEIGTTNRIHLSDYETALQDGAALILIAHKSNFKQIGFTTEPPLNQIVSLSHKYQVPVMVDLGSGTLVDLEKYKLAHETTIQDILSTHADLVCFSGDKLLGGPQAGIILGTKKIIDKIKKHPLARALRADKLCLATLSATLNYYLTDQYETYIPIYQMLARKIEDLHNQAQIWVNKIGKGTILPGKSTTGGGSLPEDEMDTWLLAIKPKSPTKFLKILRHQNPAIIARIQNDMVLMDPRTVLPFQENDLLKGIKKTLEICGES